MHVPHVDVGVEKSKTVQSTWTKMPAIYITCGAGVFQDVICFICIMMRCEM